MDIIKIWVAVRRDWDRALTCLVLAFAVGYVLILLDYLGLL